LNVDLDAINRLLLEFIWNVGGDKTEVNVSIRVIFAFDHPQRAAARDSR
jgi:hypothetical protein